MARYHVQNRAFSTGEWYTKTKTDSYPAAESVAQCHSYGRDSRIYDTHKRKVTSSYKGDESLYSSYSNNETAYRSKK